MGTPRGSMDAASMTASDRDMTQPSATPQHVRKQTLRCIQIIMRHAKRIPCSIVRITSLPNKQAVGPRSRRGRKRLYGMKVHVIIQPMCTVPARTTHLER